jgi:hypothetical protein
MESVVLDDRWSDMNFKPRPRTDLVALGTIWLGVRLWNAMLEGMDGTVVDIDMDESCRQTAF